MSAEPWKEEPDEMRFEAHGLPCAMHRGPGGSWCGYVGVPSGHPLHDKHYSDLVIDPPKELLERKLDVDKVGAINIFCAGRHGQPINRACDLVLLIDVHGGLTYSGNHMPGAKADGNWWFGFDCAHAGDFSPKYEIYIPDRVRDVYRDAAYAQKECESLARQLAEWPSIANGTQSTDRTVIPTSD